MALDFQRRYPPDPESGLVTTVMRTGQGIVLPDVTDGMPGAAARSSEHLDAVRSLNMQSVITVPLKARGRTHGAITLITERGGRVYDQVWLTLAEGVAAIAALAVDNASLYREVSRARARMEAILRGVPEGITVQSGEGRLVFANDAAAQWLGFSGAESLLATPVSDLTARCEIRDEHGDLFPMDQLPGRRALQGEPEPSALLCYRVLDTGQLRWTRVIASCLADPANGPMLAVNVMQDVTAHVEYERKLEDAAVRQSALARRLEEILGQVREERELAERARAQAEHASAAKMQFLAVVSHELRTPLNAIAGFTDLLAMQVAGPINEEQREHLTRIDGSVRHLTSLIEQILTFSRIGAGREHLVPEVLELGAIAFEVADLLEPLATGKGLGLERVAYREAARVQADAPRVRQILVNLIGNAIKFTDAGSVRVAIDRSGDQALVRVVDTGAGIPPGELERIFEPFTQVDASATRRIGGTGLGLAVSRQLARLMGGEIAVESTAGRGSSFSLSLPAILAE